MKLALAPEYEELLGGGELTPEEKLWASVLSLALIDALEGDAGALHWLKARGGDFSVVCGFF